MVIQLQPLLQDQLKLYLLIWGQRVGILNQFDKLLISELRQLVLLLHWVLLLRLSVLILINEHILIILVLIFIFLIFIVLVFITVLIILMVEVGSILVNVFLAFTFFLFRWYFIDCVLLEAMHLGIVNEICAELWISLVFVIHVYLLIHIPIIFIVSIL